MVGAAGPVSMLADVAAALAEAAFVVDVVEAMSADLGQARTRLSLHLALPALEHGQRRRGPSAAPPW